ncbi:tyrosine-type recombinase/integrase [Rhodoplanes sp. Z2-YC6860]|uniref:tyrosine-type recombinase/integrase n=1 Tax=Rhodoplanes sp. Z2-YC6860 TaxID=674703 RepID=UPI00078C4F3A|nr:site-specific integrase [Rhodoplanes sp. Z2-YC6860]AMN41088.1 integrase family protein [Rhodoplanes sp. Z2-YC6860]
MASIYRRGKTWWGRIQRGNKEYREPLETRSQSVARKRLTQWIDRLDAAAWGEKPRVTLNEIADRFTNEHLPNIRHQSARRYGVSLIHLDRELGHLMLDSIGSAELIAFETSRRADGAAAPTIRRDLACLSSMYGFAIEREIVDSNPVSAFLKRAKKRGLRENEARTRYLKKPEETKLVAAASPRRTETDETIRRRAKKKHKGPRNDAMLEAAIVVAIGSGLRLREQFDLTWDYVDLPGRLIRIPGERAKGKRSRDVVLLDSAVEALSALPRHFRSKLVFWHRDGARFRHLDRGFKAAATRAGIKDVRWHDLRRTHGCRLLQDHGWSMEMVQAQLGHQSIKQTEKAYAFLEVEQRLARADNRAGHESERPAAAKDQKANSRTNTNRTA